MKNRFKLLAVALLLMGTMVGIGHSGANASVDSVEAPATVLHNETNLSFFSCAVGRTTASPSNANHTINHSHRNADESTVDIFNQPAIDAFDCESFNPNNVLEGCVFRMYYVYDNKPDGTDLGIIGPVRRTCFS